MARWRLLPCVACALYGCASATPMLSPVRALRPGRVVLDYGMVWQAPTRTGLLNAALLPGATPEDELRAAASNALTPPGPAPYFAVRVGLPRPVPLARLEAALTLVGRDARARVGWEYFKAGNWSLGVSGALRGTVLPGTLPDVLPSVTVDRAWWAGADGTLWVGYNRAEVYDFWLGLRGGYALGGASLTVRSGQPMTYGWSLGRVELGATLGSRIAFGHLGVAIELDLLVARVSASGPGAPEPAGTVALIPGCALSTPF
ncbi:MAG: hypothetical protein HY909_27130 [Deltaproteobacteria bacterium]|nr:hypothetical protein [Deltaproteobacteria bacterium]